MNKGDSPKNRTDKVFRVSQSKNPLKVMLSEGHIFKTLAVIASSVVGGTGFEPATSTV